MHAESGTAQAVATTAPPGCAAPEQEGSRRARQRLMEALIIKVCASTPSARGRDKESPRFSLAVHSDACSSSRRARQRLGGGADHAAEQLDVSFVSRAAQYFQEQPNCRRDVPASA